ncbi:hypothetical protein B296_00052094 [Ensete ventricosum]|uniref:Uncharacterized protein n=1 Tax=Ensete ventricosum TaxID=4639 RepID=A0A426YDS7_ENSVE|nr:hypothetical protein B296_00052094 [Ensete ventricosum]
MCGSKHCHVLMGEGGETDAVVGVTVKCCSVLEVTHSCDVVMIYRITHGCLRQSNLLVRLLSMTGGGGGTATATRSPSPWRSKTPPGWTTSAAATAATWRGSCCWFPSWEVRDRRHAGHGHAGDRVTVRWRGRAPLRYRRFEL